MTISRPHGCVALRKGCRLVPKKRGLKVIGPDGTRLVRLNETGGLIVQLARRGMPVGQLAATLADAFTEPPEVVEAEVMALVEELVAVGVLEALPERPAPTVVTGVFDLGRGDDARLPDSQRRSLDWYLDHLSDLLAAPVPMSVYLDPQYEDFVWERRTREDTRFWPAPPSAIAKDFPFYGEVQRIRTDPSWLAQAEWLRASPQALLAGYAPMVMSKLALLHDQALLDPFGSDALVWVDGAISSTVPPERLSGPDFWLGLANHLSRFLLVTYPYPGGDEIHGFARSELEERAGVDHVAWVARGGIFGGDRHRLTEANTLYHELMSETLESGLMGTEESLLTILGHRHPDIFDLATVSSDGLLWPFVEEVAAGTVEIEVRDPLDGLRTALYVLSFNEPAQFELALESWSTQPGFISETENYLLDNSSEPETSADYAELCAKWGFEHVSLDNLGINGGRQFASDHFSATGCDYMIFLEDDMTLNGPDAGPCRSGLPGYVPNLYRRVHRIMETEGFDFLKFSFTEVWGDNSEQWAWYNVSQEQREELWPDYPDLPEEGLAETVPSAELRRIGCIDGLSYVTGDVYYANWPQIVSRAGNEQMFRRQRWDQPFEQYWMAYMFELSRHGELRPAVLLASPVLHDRVHSYDRAMRKES